MVGLRMRINYYNHFLRFYPAGATNILDLSSAPSPLYSYNLYMCICDILNVRNIDMASEIQSTTPCFRKTVES